jgi:hypothetical protein
VYVYVFVLCCRWQDVPRSSFLPREREGPKNEKLESPKWKTDKDNVKETLWEEYETTEVKFSKYYETMLSIIKDLKSRLPALSALSIQVSNF